MKDKVKKVKVELIAKELVMSERHQVKLVKIEIFGARGARPVTRDSIPRLEAKSLEPFYS